MLAFLLFLASPAALDLRTTAEVTGYQATGRYAEVERLCRAFEGAFPGRARCFVFGQTPERRPLYALAASEDGTLDPAAARKAGRLVVLFQAGMHAGEIDGKDAGFALLRSLLQAKGGPLAAITTVFVPVANPDGHERFGPHHRPNQNGPAETGFRTNAQNLNLNRDFAKAEAPETRTLLGLLNDWDPIAFVDLHVTDGADFQPEIAFMVEPAPVGEPGLAAAGRELLEGVVARLRARGFKPIEGFYPAFLADDDPASGFRAYTTPPRFASGYWRVRNRLGVLVETHSWKDYRTRVRVTEAAVLATLELAAARGQAWRSAAAAADRAAERIAGQDVVLDWKASEVSRTIEFPGFAYERRPSKVSLSPWIVYDSSKPEVWRVPFFGTLAPVLTVKAPRAGYLVTAGHAAWVAAKLEAHGIQFTALDRTLVGVEVGCYRATEVEVRPVSVEGRQCVRVRGTWSPERRDVPAGSLYVPISQSRAALVMHLLEPEAPDSFLAWGFLNAHLEQKEYLEPYVAEKIAAEMLRDPAVQKAFDDRLASDPAFAKNPQARLEFFARRHPSFDDRYRLYPIFRLEERKF